VKNNIRIHILSIIAIFIVSILEVKAQNYIYFGDNQYESTNTWKFNTPMGAGANCYLDATVSKAPNNGGYLMLSTSDAHFDFQYIGGQVFVFLEDGSRIVCNDKGIRDRVNDRAISLYYFTAAEIETLKIKNIVRIRFTIMNKNVPAGMAGAGNYSVDLQGDSSFKTSGTFPDTYSSWDTVLPKTSEEIAKLFDD
jgi:hypothetical protein